jgi:hypothetical protein
MKKFIVAALIAGSLLIAAPAQAHGNHYGYLRYVNSNSPWIRTVNTTTKLQYGHTLAQMMHNGFGLRRLVRICDQDLPRRACVVFVTGSYKFLY